MRVPGFVPAIAALAFWAALVGASLHHNLALLDDQAREVAFARARMLFSIVETTRFWNAQHGGLYAPVTEQTPPNEWLTDPDRDVVINDRLFTKINPAYMTRQISELMHDQGGFGFHLTSLNPIRPANAADEWETRALQYFEKGLTEVLDRVSVNGEDSFRYMGRLLVQPPCMSCHAQQGYQIGQVRGGISVTIPAAQVAAEIEPQMQQTRLMHGIGFILLAGGSLVFLAWLRMGWRQLAQAKADQERMVVERTAELSRAVKELARSNAELENFAYVASHDLQEPLRMMGSYAQLIERRYSGLLDEEGREFLGYMGDGAQRMKRMIDDLLAYSRVGRGEKAFEPVQLDHVLDIALANLTASVDDAGGEIIRKTPLPLVAGESSLLVRLMQNLISNSLKYKEKCTTPKIEISAERLPDHWRISVADNGIGIPEQARERVFQIFQRLHAADAYPGTGIGLAIAKKIVDRHGGRIWVEANAPHGCVFIFTLPIADVAQAQQQNG